MGLSNPHCGRNSLLLAVALHMEASWWKSTQLYPAKRQKLAESTYRAALSFSLDWKRTLHSGVGDSLGYL